MLTCCCGAHPSARASEKSSGRLQLTCSNTLCKNDSSSIVLKQSAAEHHRRSLRGQAHCWTKGLDGAKSNLLSEGGVSPLNSWVTNQVLLIFCLVGVPILASKLRPNANAFPQSIISCEHVVDADWWQEMRLQTGADLKVMISIRKNS